jgi:hypothetical protein
VRELLCSWGGVGLAVRRCLCGGRLSVMMDGPARGRGVRYTGLLAGVGTKAVPGFSEPDGGAALSLRTAGLGALLVSIGVGMTSNLLPCGVSVSPGLVSGADADRRCWCDFGGIVALGDGAGLIGYYLAPAVLAYVLWRRLRPHNALVADLSATAAFGNTLVRGVGAAVWPWLGRC